MENLEELYEEVLKRIRFRDMVAAVAISTAFIVFGIIVIILLDVIAIPSAFKMPASIFLLISTWILMIIGVYLLTSMPLPPLPTKIVVDSEGLQRLMEMGYSGRIYVTRQTFKKIPPKLALRANLQVIDVDERDARKFAKFGEELSYAIACAKKIRAKVVSTRKLRAKGVEIITAEDFIPSAR
ncbi:MAG: hypothetical protein V6S10_08455 [Candidatus Methanoglobus sp.]